MNEQRKVSMRLGVEKVLLTWHPVLPPIIETDFLADVLFFSY